MEQPTQDEINRVGAYWQWVKDMACTHSEWTSTVGNEWTCGHCGRPLVVMSDVQLEARTAKKEVSSGT